jgi:hypothetical protein
MPKPAKIILYEPDLAKPRKFFSISIKSELVKETGAPHTAHTTFVISGKNHTFYSFTERLITFGLINNQYRWTFGSKHLVVLGYLSHCPRSLWLMYGLEERAKRQSGEIHYLPEADSYIKMRSWINETPDYAYHSRSKAGHTSIMFDGHFELFRWLKTKKNTIKIGNKYFSTNPTMPPGNNIFNADNRLLFDGILIQQEDME